MTASPDQAPADDMGVTGNAVLLHGYIGGSITARHDDLYELVSLDAAAGTQVIKRRGTGNTYRITVVQLEGVE